MPFTEIQKAQFIALLQTKGSQILDGTISSPGGGLWFSEAHFGDWDPIRVRELFIRRAARLEKCNIGDLRRAIGENLQASWAAEEVMKSNEA